MSSKRLRVPVILAVTTAAALTSCQPPPPPPDDVPDGTVADAVDATSMDACPDPFACYLDFQYLPDGAYQVIYRRLDGSVSTTDPCPPAPPGCPVA